MRFNKTLTSCLVAICRVLFTAITKAFAAGAAGILISREYDEMRIESLKTIGETLAALGKA